MTVVVPHTGNTIEVQIHKAKLMAEASILPEAYRKQPANILVAMEVADTLGITLFQAIQGVDVIKGRMAMKPELMRALILRAGHRFRVDVQAAEGCRVIVARAENPDDEQVFEYTIRDAAQAGLAGQAPAQPRPLARDDLPAAHGPGDRLVAAERRRGLELHLVPVA